MGKYKTLIIFLFYALALYIGWFLLYELYLHPQGYIDSFVIKNSIYFSKQFLQLLGYTVYTVNERQVWIESANGLWVGDPCNGLNLFALFSGFIIAYPGVLKSKLIFIPVGIVLIHLLNILRISGLLLLQLYAPEYMEFNHTYTFTIIIYAFIFYLWMHWVNKYSFKQKETDAKE